MSSDRSVTYAPGLYPMSSLPWREAGALRARGWVGVRRQSSARCNRPSHHHRNLLSLQRIRRRGDQVRTL